jgi:hypothetical protein
LKIAMGHYKIEAGLLAQAAEYYRIQTTTYSE